MKQELYSDLVTVGDAARFLGVSDTRIRQLERAFRLTAVRASDGTRLVMRDSLVAEKARRASLK